MAGDGSRKTRSFATEEEAQAFVVSVESPTAEPARLDAYAAQWFHGYKNQVKGATAARYRSALNKYVIPHLGDRYLADLTASDIRAWQSGLLETRSPATVRMARAVLSQVIKDAIVDGLITANPLSPVSGPRRPKKPVRILSEAEISVAARSIEPRWRVLVLMAAYCGLRIGELCALRNDEVDFNRSVITVRRTLTRSDLGYGEGPAKTDSSSRDVAVPRWLLDEVEIHRGHGYSGETYLFTGSRGKSQLGYNHFLKYPWARMCEAAGLEGITPHDLRHTAVSLWIESGASPLLVARRAGHANVTTVLNTYGHLFGHEDAELAEKLRPPEGPRPIA